MFSRKDIVVLENITVGKGRSTGGERHCHLPTHQPPFFTWGIPEGVTIGAMFYLFSMTWWKIDDILVLSSHGQWFADAPIPKDTRPDDANCIVETSSPTSQSLMDHDETVAVRATTLDTYENSLQAALGWTVSSTVYGCLMDSFCPSSKAPFINQNLGTSAESRVCSPHSCTVFRQKHYQTSWFLMKFACTFNQFYIIIYIYIYMFPANIQKKSAV